MVSEKKVGENTCENPKAPLIVWMGIAWKPVAPAGRPPPAMLAGEFAG